jgi:tripartite-type tricarboxylate transporter receptor subunit TctC
MLAAEDYPTRPVRIITSGAGGSSDFTARQIAQGISGPLGQQVVVENRGSGINPGLITSKASPDGYTLLLAGGTFLTFPLLQKTPYDPVNDFSPVTIVERGANIVLVHTGLPAKSIKELIALAKVKPGELNYASTGIGSPTHLATELFKSMAGINMVHVPYNGNQQAISDLIGGRMNVMFLAVSPAAPHVKAGTLRPLAVTSAVPSALAPGVPTVSASGLPGYESVQMTTMFSPAKTPPLIINRLNREIVLFLNAPAIKEKFLAAGIEVVGSTPQELATAMKAEIARLGKVIKDTGIKAE